MAPAPAPAGVRTLTARLGFTPRLPASTNQGLPGLSAEPLPLTRALPGGQSHTHWAQMVV